MSNSIQVEDTMNESMRESLSALMDGEANEVELHRILANISDPELRTAWSTLHRNSDIMRGSAAISGVDISRAVSESIAGLGITPVADTVPLGGIRRSVVSFAVAASVTAVVVFSGQQWLTSSAGIAPLGAGSPGLVTPGGAVPVQASFGSRIQPASTQPLPAAGAGYQELARQRLRKYSQAHAEQAALNTPQGLVPFARVQEIQIQ